MKKENKKQANTFYHYANRYRMKATEEEEIETIDMTNTMWAEFDTMIETGELINVNINAPPTSGKSVTGFAIADKLMKKHFKRKFDISDIDRDQQEFSKTMRNSNIKKTIRVIDEWNELEETGENSSVEIALYNYFSDVMAQRFVHKISCSPKEECDKNALVYLEVISTDKQNGINHCKLYYKLFNGGYEIKQLLGYVSIDVNGILKSKWYKEYRRRKFEKMDLILKEGIFRPRILEYAGIILKITEKLKKITKISNVLNANIVRNYVKIEMRKNKVPQSIIGEELATREVMGILDLYRSYWKLCKDQKRIEDEFNKGKLEHHDYKSRAKNVDDMKRELLSAWQIQEDELKRYKEIYDEYNKKLTK